MLKTSLRGNNWHGASGVARNPFYAHSMRPRRFSSSSPPLNTFSVCSDTFVVKKVCEDSGRRGVLEEIEGYLLDNIDAF